MHMAYSDVEMSDVFVVLDESAAATQFDILVIRLKEAGLFVEKADSDNGVVEGTIQSALLKALEALPEVKYVRAVFNYVADYPVGDPRNLDEDDRPDEHILR